MRFFVSFSEIAKAYSQLCQNSMAGYIFEAHPILSTKPEAPHPMETLQAAEKFGREFPGAHPSDAYLAGASDMRRECEARGLGVFLGAKTI